MKVAYITPYYNSEMEPRIGTFHELIHTVRDMEDKPFEFDIYPFTLSNSDHTVSYTPESDDLEIVDIRAISKKIKNKDYDIINVVTVHPYTLIAAIRAKREEKLIIGPHISPIYPIRTDGKYENSPIKQKIKWFVKYIANSLLLKYSDFDKGYTISPYAVDLCKYYWIDTSKIDILPPAIHPIFKPTPRSQTELFTILYVGALSEHKGYNTLIRSLRYLSSGIRVQVVGENKFRDLPQKPKQFEGELIYEGYQSRSQLVKYYNNADLTVIPSISETGPQTLLESLACGTPAVCSKGLGFNVFAPEDAIIETSTKTPRDLAEAIKTAITNIDTMKEATLDSTDRYKIKNQIDFLKNIY